MWVGAAYYLSVCFYVVQGINLFYGWQARMIEWWERAGGKSVIDPSARWPIIRLGALRFLGEFFRSLTDDRTTFPFLTPSFLHHVTWTCLTFFSWKFAGYSFSPAEMWKKVSSVKEVKRRWNFILYPKKKCLTGYQRKSIYLLSNIWYDVLHGKCVRMHYSSPREENIVE